MSSVLLRIMCTLRRRRRWRSVSQPFRHSAKTSFEAVAEVIPNAAMPILKSRIRNCQFSFNEPMNALPRDSAYSQDVLILNYRINTFPRFVGILL